MANVSDTQFSSAVITKDTSLLKLLFTLQLANVARFKTPFSLVFLGVHPASEVLKGKTEEDEKRIGDAVEGFLEQQVRNSDLVFHLSFSRWAVLLTHSGEEEAEFFCNRIFKELVKTPLLEIENHLVELSASIVEVANSLAAFEDVIKAGEEGLYESIQVKPFFIQKVPLFKKRETERIKVSIIEEDEVAVSILHSLLERTAIEYFELDIQTFEDGAEFLESSWYHSGHTHLVILNDILPKKNGIEVLHFLRNRPNDQKYIIFMLSKRNSEENIVYAYEHGVDEYVIKPFNINLLEAQMKKVLKRLRL